MGKICLILLLILGLSFSQPQVTIGLGKTKLNGSEFRFPANSGFINFTLRSDPRLQFGLQYEATSALLDKRTFYNSAGLLFTTKLMFNTESKKSPYLGFNFGWVNSSLAAEKVIYQARGSFCGEALAGYSFVLDEEARFNIEYQQRYIELKYEDQPLQRSETFLASISWLLVPGVTIPEKPKDLTPLEGATNRREYLEKKFTYNQEQLKKYEVLLRKYELNLQEGNDQQLAEERDYLLRQKAEIQKQNEDIKEELTKL